MTIDETTGLPALPPKYRWRVTDYLDFGGWEVRLQRRWLGMWFTTDAGFTRKDATPELVRSLAEYAYESWRARQVPAALLRNPYRGKYPPKRLEDK